MKKLVFVTLFAVSTLLTQSGFAKDSFTLIHVSELEAFMKVEKSSVHIYDANNDQTRVDEGMIPTAEALSSSSHYDVATLPKDKAIKVVFYCANTQCMASHDAAKVAAKAGHKNIFVMADGIQGWKKAGKTTQKFDKKG